MTSPAISDSDKKRAWFCTTPMVRSPKWWWASSLFRVSGGKPPPSIDERRRGAARATRAGARWRDSGGRANSTQNRGAAASARPYGRSPRAARQGADRLVGRMALGHSVAAHPDRGRGDAADLPGLLHVPMGPRLLDPTVLLAVEDARRGRARRGRRVHRPVVGLAPQVLEGPSGAVQQA